MFQLFEGALEHGSFGKKLIYYKFLKSSRRVKDYYIFFHGAYSSGFNKEHENLAKIIVSKVLGNVFLFESSRKKYSFDELKINYEEYEKSFLGKSFSDELEDAKKAVDFLWKVLVEDKDINFHFVGFSLGGAICSFLIQGFPALIKSIFLLGSGVSSKNNDKPILNSFPSKKAIIANFSKFKGKIILIQGSEDKVVPIIEARKIIFDTKNPASKKLIILKGVDHRFRTIDGVLKEKKLTNFIFNLIKRETEEKSLK